MKLRTFLLPFGAFLLLSSLSLPAQDQVVMPQNMIGTAADSVTGGPPSVMIRRVMEVEHKSKKRNLVAVDPLKMITYYNLSYYRMLSYAFSVGGGVQFIGPVYDSAVTNAIGFQLGAKYFLAGDGPEGLHIDPALYVYAVKYEGISSNPISTVLDGGYKIDVGPCFFDFKIGIEYFLRPLESGDNDSSGPGVFMVAEEDERTALHIAAHFGANW